MWSAVLEFTDKILFTITVDVRQLLHSLSCRGAPYAWRSERMAQRIVRQKRTSTLDVGGAGPVASPSYTRPLLSSMARRFHIYSLNWRYLQLKVHISAIELEISPIDLQIYAIQLQISTNRAIWRYLQFIWRYLQMNWRYLQIGRIWRYLQFIWRYLQIDKCDTISAPRRKNGCAMIQVNGLIKGCRPLYKNTLLLIILWIIIIIDTSVKEVFDTATHCRIGDNTLLRRIISDTTWRI